MAKKVLVCNAQIPFLKGGSEALAQSLTEELNKRGFEAELIQLPFKWYPRHELIKNCLSWRLLDMSESNFAKVDLLIATKFPSYVVKHPNKVCWLVHQHRYAYDLFGQEPSDYFQRMTFFSNSEEDQKIRQTLWAIDVQTLQEAQKLFTISENVSKRLLRFNGLRSHVLYPPPKFMNSVAPLHYGDYILCVGRVEKLKRVDLLIKALKDTPKEIKAIVVGTGPEREPLEKLTQELNLKKRVEFAGYVDENSLMSLYAHCFAVYYAPYDEDYGYVTLEALSFKKPIVTTSDSGGVLEFVQEEINGLLSPPEPERVSQNIQRLFIDKDLCKAMGQKGYSFIKDITWDKVIKELTSTL